MPSVVDDIVGNDRSSELSTDVCHCWPNVCCRWLMLLLHFGLFLSDHMIGYHQRARPNGFGHWGRCDDVAYHLNALLGQGDKWRVWWDHLLD
jgi:hypothetical protein